MNLGNKISLHRSLSEIFDKVFPAKIDYLLTWPIQRQLDVVRNEITGYLCHEITINKLKKLKL